MVCLASMSRGVPWNTTFAPGLRAYVYDVVGIEHHVFVVLNHNDRVAYVAQFFQRSYEPLVVALVQAYAGLVEYIQHIDELRAYLRGKPDALALSSRQRGRLPVERKVVEPHLEQEVYARANLLQNLFRYLFLLLVEMAFGLVEPFA